MDLDSGDDEEQAMIDMALSLGFSKSEARKSYKKAKKKDVEVWKAKQKQCTEEK